jgi:hypothetical protein
MHGERLDAAIGRVESVVVRVLRGVAGRLARLVGGSPSPAALSDDDLQVIRGDWVDAVTVEIVPAVAEAYRESAEVLAKEFADAGRPVEVVSLEAPTAADFLDAATNRLVGVADTLWEVARKELADGVRAGEGIEELAACLQEAGGFGEARARTIARTEVVAAANAASLTQALRLGDPSMVKEWLDSDDDRVRQAHEFADQQTVPVGEPFEVGGEFLMYPGQPIGSPSNTINERCTLGYSWDEADAPITAAAEVHTGAMVAFRPTAADAKRLTVEDGEPADQLHVTLAYLGEAADIPPEVQQTLVDRLTALVEDAVRPDYELPLTAEGFAIDVFNPPNTARDDGKDRDTCIVLGLSGDDLAAVHTMVAETVREVFEDAGLALPDQHQPWIPHSTLIYTDDVDLAPKLVDRTGPVAFDAIRVAFGGENTDIPLTPVAPTVAAADSAGDDASSAQPAHVGGVDLADSGLQVDGWGDGTFSITDPDGGGLWLDEDEANDLIDALNQVRSGGSATTVNAVAGGLEVARDDTGQILLVPQNDSDGWTLTDDDAYDLSYWLAYWLDKGGYYYDDEGAEAAAEPEEPLTAARRPWDPLKHPRGPDGRFIGKGIVGRASGDTTASKATRRTEPPAALPARPETPDDPRRAELSRLRVAELRTLLRERGGKPGRLRKAELVDRIATAETAEPTAPVAPATPTATAETPTVQERFGRAATGQQALDAAGVRLDSTAGTGAYDGTPASIVWQHGSAEDWTPQEADQHGAVLEGYRGADFRHINLRLRGTMSQRTIDTVGGDDPDAFLSGLDVKVASIDDVMDRSRTDQDAVAWRGTFSGRGVFGDAIKGDLTGREWTEDAFVSTSASEDMAAEGFARGHGLLMRILIPSGTGAVAMSPLGGGDDDLENDEAELLLERGLRFRVVSDSGPGDGIRRVDAEVIGGGRPGRSEGGPAGANVDGTGGLPAPEGGPSGPPDGAGTGRAAVEGDAAGPVEPPGAPGSAERLAAAKTDIRDAVEQLRVEPDGYVMLNEVRDMLGGRYDRDDVDRALIELNRDPDVRIVPETNQKVLTQAQRDGAVRVGTQDRHLITLLPPENPTTDGQKRTSALEDELREAEASGETARVRQIRAELDRRQARRDTLAQPVAATPAPVAAQVATDVAGPPVSGQRADVPLTGNEWGRVIDQDAVVQFHPDGEIGNAIRAMGADARIDVDGRPLGDVLGMLATDAVVGRSTSQEVLDKLKVLRGRLPDGNARRQLDIAIGDLDAPDTAIPDVPDGIPDALRQLMADLHAVPLVRRDPSLEEDPLADLLAQVASGRLQGSRLIGALRRLRNRRHESVEGKFEIDRAIDRAVAALQPPRPAARPEGFTAEGRMTETGTTADIEAGDDGWGDYFASRIAEFVASDEKLREYWIHGEGAAKIRWGQDGDFTRCVRQLRRYVRDPEGLCASYHHEALGKWPAEKDHASLAVSADAEAATAGLEAQPGEHFHTKVLEGVSTGMRQFAPGAISWRTPPFAYHWQYKSSAHNGVPETVQVGLITRAERDGDLVHFWGRLDLRSAEGLDYARRLVEGFARWSSVRADESVKDRDIDVEYVLDAGTGEPDEDPEIDLMTFNQYRVAEISGVSVPALADATVEPTQELIDTLVAMGVIEPAQVADEPPAVEEVQEEQVPENLADAGGETSDLAADITTVVVAAGHTITLPEAPPAGWFDEPADDELPPYGSVRVDANGRLIGLLAPARVNHRSFPGKRVTVPMGNVDYSGWMNKARQVAEGHSINVGVITMDCGHASTNPQDWSYSHRREHYDNTCSIAAHACAYEKPGIGVALAGAIVPWLDADGFGKLLSSDLSGDWPPHPDRPGWRDFTAALAVPVGGFPHRAARLRMAEGTLVAAAVPVAFDDETEILMEEMEDAATVLAEGTRVRVLDPRDPEVTEGEIAVVHDGPAYALMVPGRDEPVRWYVAEELESADAAPVVDEMPVEELVASVTPDLRPALERVAKSVGLDTRTRMDSLHARVHARS